MSYRTVVVDPPWPYQRGLPRWTKDGIDNSDNLPYSTLSLEEIGGLPVAQYCEADAHLYLWTTNAFLEHSWKIARAWGFEPSTMLAWCKPPRGFAGRATFATCLEFCLFARRGALKAQQRLYRNWWEWPRGRHSAKPEAFYDLVEQVSPGPYLELFARRQRLGWDTWGNEALEHIGMEITP